MALQSVWLISFCILICGAASVWGAQVEQLSVESRAQQKDDQDLSESIKYLEKLDNYIYENARPRFGRSDFKQQQQPIGRYSTSSTDRIDSMMRDENARAALLELARSQLIRKYHHIEPMF